MMSPSFPSVTTHPSCPNSKIMSFHYPPKIPLNAFPLLFLLQLNELLLQGLDVAVDALYRCLQALEEVLA